MCLNMLKRPVINKEQNIGQAHPQAGRAECCHNQHIGWIIYIHNTFSETNKTCKIDASNASNQNNLNNYGFYR